MPRTPALPVLLAALALAPAAAPAAERASVLSAPLEGDPVLARLVEEALAARPELAQARAAARAERARVPQAGALPDPTLSLGIQNDGFSEIMVGEMESSYYLVMLSQGLPWPGKRGLRTDVARLGAEQADVQVERARLDAIAAVRSAYVDLLLVRDRLALLDRLEALWQKSAGVVQARYEAGEGAQSDLLRTRLELTRLRQRRWALQAEERTRVLALNRLRARPLHEAVPTAASIQDLGLPPIPAAGASAEDALARSPELRAARLGTSRADASVRLARRERFPDLSLSAGIMPRGGEFDPMWQATVGISLPVWSGRKQAKAVDEARARGEAAERGAAAVEQTLLLRVDERRTALATLLDTVKLYREGLLVQSQATTDSTLTQYRVGKVTFASVLDANVGHLQDEEGLLLALADAQRIAIAADAVSLDPPGANLAPGGMASGAVPGAGAIAPGGGGGGGAPAAGAPAAGGGSGAPAMGGM
jgi:outer membrane protein TolC